MAIPVTAPVAGAAAPVAIPLTAHPPAASPPAPGGVFTGLDPTSPKSRPRRARFSWMPLLLGLLLLGGSAAATVHYWPQIAPLLEGRDPAVAQNGDEERDRTPSAPNPEDDKDRSSKEKGSSPKDGDTGNKEKTTPPDPTKDRRNPPADPNKDKPKPPPRDPNKDKPKPPPVDPNKDKPKPDPNKDRTTDPTKVTPRPKPFDGSFPRRALVISVHNYLFANPISAGDNSISGRNLQNFMGQLSQTRSWRISPAQTAFLSDAARPPRHQPYPPIRATIENTITEYLKNSRPQDHVVLMFIGHAVELEGKGYLAPIEADLTVAGSMIPLDWVYKQLEDCPARQKLLVLDVCRFNPARGEERPSSGPLGAKFDLALKNPPAGVQVWSSCIEGQQSYEIEDAGFGNSVFMDALYQVSVNGIEGVQRPEDPIPLEKLVQRVNEVMGRTLGPRKIEQISRLSGSMKNGGAAFDPNEKPAPEPVVLPAVRKNNADATLVRSILKELSVPPIKKQQDEGLLRFEALPPFPADSLDKFPVDNTPHPLRDAVERAQATLWAISNNAPPGELAAAVEKIKASGELKANIGTLKEGYQAPRGAGNAETQFKNGVFDDTRKVASIIRILEEELQNMEAAGKMKKDAPKRWQANYDFMMARLQAQIAYVYEYASMLGAMRKEFPPRDPAVHNGWRLASRKKLQGDGTGRKLARDAEKILDRLAQEYPGTPWEILAKREKFTALGLEWKPN